MPSSSTAAAFDVAVVGGGPAGLTAAVYLARFLRSVVVCDAEDGRARLIPKTRNCPGFPEGLRGEDLLVRLRRQAGRHGVRRMTASVEQIRATARSFLLRTSAGDISATFVILATGIVDRTPAITGLREAIHAGSIRLCPVCDAYEARGRHIGIIGAERPALREALFLKDYSPDVTMLFNYPEDVSTVTRQEAAQAGIEIWDAVDNVVPQAQGLKVIMAGGAPAHNIDIIYPAMGCDVRSELAIRLGAHCDEDGYVFINGCLETSVPGLYAIGDVAKGLNQIAVGFGQAAQAASHIHDKLRAV